MLKQIEQFNSVNTVKLENNQLITNCVVLEKKWEGELTLFIDVKTFKINKGVAEIHLKGKDYDNIYYELKELEGLSGYMDGKKDMNKLLEYNQGDKLKYMAIQCINGMIQGETYVYKKRGFDTKDSYNKYWDKLEENGCRMYSNIHPDDLSWMDYAGPISRKYNLFNRFKRVYIKKIGKGERVEFNVMASFTDSYHELVVDMVMMGKEMMVEKCEIDFVRAPGVACFQNGVHGENFIGKKFALLDKKQIIESFGKSQGCYHIVDVMLDVYRKIKEMEL